MLKSVSSDKSIFSEMEYLRKENAELKPFRLICDNIPVPMLVTLLSDSSVVYANRPAASLFGVYMDDLMRSKIIEFFYAPEDRQSLLDALVLRGYLNNYELKGRKKDGSIFWAELFIQPFKFDDKHCLLSIWYDITQRKHSEEELARLNKALEDKEKEGKYLTFIIDDEEYGISILKVQNIIPVSPVTALMHMPDFIEGVINLRGAVIPVVNLRKKLEMEASEHTNRTCIIIVEVSSKEDKKSNGLKHIGIIVDCVSEVLTVKGKDIKSIPEVEDKTNWDYISGIALKKGKMIPLIDIDYIVNTEDIKNIEI